MNRAQPVLIKRFDLFFGVRDAAERRTSEDAHVDGAFERNARIFASEQRCDDRHLRKSIGPLEAAAIHMRRWVEIANLGRDFRRILGCVETRDAVDGDRAVEEPLPERIFADAQRRDEADAGNGDAMVRQGRTPPRDV